ncbi:Dirigent protein 19 [Sesamum angolense]|uniref:Dirigent protein n=1 Tax=Sesamum angolense TaxID=2727404 RepID=A0AAE1WXT6_9LAMI|nr:Dirigent protein 19 [Sesamum angolense]
MLSCSLLIISLLVTPIQSEAQKGPIAVENWFSKLPNAKEKLTKLHFYFHDIVSGKKPTKTFASPTYFGLVSVIDNPLTAGTAPKSQIVGRAQGITAYTSFTDFSLLMTLNLVFTSGEYNGSTLSVVGYNPFTQEYREMPIVGGSGLFRLARGVATAQTAKFNRRTGNAVVEYNVMVLHY